MISLIIRVVSLVAIVGCAARAPSDKVPAEGYVRPEQDVVARIAERMHALEPGLTRSEVLDRLGLDPYGLYTTFHSTGAGTAGGSVTRYRFPPHSEFTLIVSDDSDGNVIVVEFERALDTLEWRFRDQMKER